MRKAIKCHFQFTTLIFTTIQLFSTFVRRLLARINDLCAYRYIRLNSLESSVYEKPVCANGLRLRRLIFDKPILLLNLLHVNL